MANGKNALVVYQPPQQGAGRVPANVKTYVQAQLGRKIEQRRFDTSGAFPASPTLAPTVVNNIPPANRDGEVVNFDEQHVRFTVAPSAAGFTTKGPVRFRYILFEWRPLSIPTTPDILETSTVASIINSPFRFTTRQFYRVLIDQVFSLHSNYKTVHDFQRVVKLKNQKVRFDDSVSPGDAVRLLYYLVVSDTATAADQPGFNYNHRTLYTDA